jgi:hypothetical protein
VKTLIKPKEGLIILDPRTKLKLKVEGDLVDMSTYWKRRILDGDVEIVMTEEAKIETKIDDKKESKLGGKK